MRKCKNCTTGLFWACASDYCYQERQGLVEEAQDRAEMHGHVLAPFVKERKQPVWRARCVGCGLEAVIRLDPSLGEPDVYGPALVMECPKRDQVRSGSLESGRESVPSDAPEH
jgi:hypothetical protein